MVGAQCLHNVPNLVVAVVHLLLPLHVVLLAVLVLLVPDRRNMQMKSPKHHALIIKPKNSN